MWNCIKRTEATIFCSLLNQFDFRFQMKPITCKFNSLWAELSLDDCSSGFESSRMIATDREFSTKFIQNGFPIGNSKRTACYPNTINGDNGLGR